MVEQQKADLIDYDQYVELEEYEQTGA
jgi:ATP-dependent RNA helicase UAP56/SUB2